MGDKETLEVWLKKLGFNPSTEVMESLTATIRSNASLDFYFSVLKHHLRPKAEANKIHKYYLYSILKRGEFGFDIPKFVAITSQRDMECCRKYMQSFYKVRALNIVKIPNECEIVKKLTLEVNQQRRLYSVSYEAFVKNSNRQMHLSELEKQLVTLKSEILSTLSCIEVVLGKRIGSEDYQEYFKMPKHVIDSIVLITGIQSKVLLRDPNKAVQSLHDKFKESLLKFDFAFNNVDEWGPKSFFETVFDNVNLNRLMEESTSVLTTNNEINPDKEQTIKIVMDYLGENKILKCSIDEVLTMANNFYQLLQAPESIEEILLKRNAKQENLTLLVNKTKDYISCIKKMPEAQSHCGMPSNDILTPEQFAVIESIFTKWQTSIDDPNICSILLKKRQELIIYKSIESDSNRFKYLDHLCDDQDNLKLLAEEIEEFAKLCGKISENNLFLKNLPTEIIKLIPFMPFVELNNVPINKIMIEVKELLCVLAILKVMPM